MKREIVYKELSYKINGLLYEVHNELGRFCNEKQCADLFEKKLILNKIKYQRELILPVSFDGEKKGRNRIDFLIEDKIIVEFKNKRIIARDDYNQIKRYLKSLDKKLGLLVNFNDKYLKPRRILNSDAEV